MAYAQLRILLRGETMVVSRPCQRCMFFLLFVEWPHTVVIGLHIPAKKCR